MMKIVIDTNLLVAYMFNKRSASAEIIDLAEKGKVDVMWHKKIKSEALLITGKIGKAVPKVKIDLKSIFKKKNELAKLPRIKNTSKDPDDDKFLACALAAEADMIVSNDEHLLTLKSFQGIPIYSSGEALKVLKKSTRT